jgi:hypothetical protein
MNEKLKSTLGFLIGAGLFMFTVWLAGRDFPSERGPFAVFYFFESLCSGMVGLVFTKLHK